MAKSAVKRTGYTNDTPKNFIVDAGSIYKNVTWNAAQNQYEGERLGATAGGNKVKIEQKFRDIEIDGTFSNYKGQKILMASNAILETNVKELTAANIALAINGKTRTLSDNTEGPQNAVIIEGKGKLEDSDYLTNIALVGTVTGSDKPVIIILDNPLCTSGLDIDLKDDAEAVVKMVFEAHADAEQVADRKLPARIIYPEIA